jgi:hypothetical protein
MTDKPLITLLGLAAKAVIRQKQMHEALCSLKPGYEFTTSVIDQELAELKKAIEEVTKNYTQVRGGTWDIRHPEGMSYPITDPVFPSTPRHPCAQYKEGWAWSLKYVENWSQIYHSEEAATEAMMKVILSDD